MTAPHPNDLLLFSRERAALVGDDSGLRRAARNGTLLRLGRGVFIPPDDWRRLSYDDRYRARVFAAARTRRDDAVLCSFSAAAVWRLPIVGAWPDDVHLLTERTTGGRSHPGIRRHAVGLQHAGLEFIDGVAVTGIARTLVDLGAQATFTAAVAAMDYALRAELTTKDELRVMHANLMPFRGSVRAAHVIEFASHLSGSVAESASRVTMAMCRFPQPELQRRFITENGESFFADYWFRGVKVIGEVDGRKKYEDPEFLRGRTPEQALWEEKLREDWLRAHSDGFARWDWHVSLSPRLLTQRLLHAGVPQLPPGHPEGFPFVPPAPPAGR